MRVTITTNATAGALEVVTRKVAFRATGEAFTFLEKNPWFVRYVFAVYLIWVLRKPLNKLFGWCIERLPEKGSKWAKY